MKYHVSNENGAKKQLLDLLDTNKKTLVVFGSPTCPPCVEILAHINKMNASKFNIIELITSVDEKMDRIVTHTKRVLADYQVKDFSRIYYDNVDIIWGARMKFLTTLNLVFLDEEGSIINVTGKLSLDELFDFIGKVFEMDLTQDKKDYLERENQEKEKQESPDKDKGDTLPSQPDPSEKEHNQEKDEKMHTYRDKENKGEFSHLAGYDYLKIKEKYGKNIGQYNLIELEHFKPVELKDAMETGKPLVLVMGIESCGPWIDKKRELADYMKSSDYKIIEVILADDSRPETFRAIKRAIDSENLGEAAKNVYAMRTDLFYEIGAYRTPTILYLDEQGNSSNMSEDPHKDSIERLIRNVSNTISVK